MRSLRSAEGSKIFKFHDFTEEEPEVEKTGDIPYLTFSDEDFIVRKAGPSKTEAAPQPQPGETPQETAEPEEEAREDPSIAAAEQRITDAEAKAEEIIGGARAEAEGITGEARRKAGELFAKAKEEGYDDGYARGLAEGNKAGREQTLRESKEKYDDFFEAIDRACESIDAQKEESLSNYEKELIELVLAIAEKIVCVSLDSSGEVIKRMILSSASPAVDRQWAKVTIAASDAERMMLDGINIKSELYAVSDKIDLVIVEGAARGTCLVEFPEQAIDAGAVTQLRNISDAIHNEDSD